MDAVIRPGIDTPLYPSIFTNFELGSVAENPILIDEEHDKGNSPPPHATTSDSERPTRPPLLMRICPLGQELRMLPIMFIEIDLNNFHYRYYVCILR